MRYLRLALALTAGLIIAAGTGYVAAEQASASTPACAAGPLGTYCGTLQSGNGHVADVAGGAQAGNTPVIAWADGNDPATDFAILTAPRGGIELIYTPRGAWTGLCASDPGGGYPADPAGANGIVLRGCNGSNFQRWTFTGSFGESNPAVFTNAASGLVLTDEGYGGQLVDTTAVASDPAQQWTDAAL
jgi:hypothetical protein